MPGISPKLPLNRDSVDGFETNKTFVGAIRQNLKMLVLTSPGERIMYPTFGVGIRQFLFENNSFTTYSDIEEKIREQVASFLPEVAIISIRFLSQNNEDIMTTFEGSGGSNFVNLIINYEVPSLFVSDTVNILV